MKSQQTLFERWYYKALEWASHKHALLYLMGLTCVESIFFPFPPDALLIPMALARPKQAYFLACVTTLASVIGGVLGYLLGLYAFTSVGESLLSFFGYHEQFEYLKSSFEHFGIYFVIIAGFTPIPYKLITITAGCLEMELFPFIVGSLIGRAARFYLVAGLARFGKEAFETTWLPRLTRISYLVLLVSLCLIAFWCFR